MGAPIHIVKNIRYTNGPTLENCMVVNNDADLNACKSDSEATQYDQNYILDITNNKVYVFDSTKTPKWQEDTTHTVLGLFPENHRSFNIITQKLFARNGNTINHIKTYVTTDYVNESIMPLIYAGL